jgi:hypothetical protein
LNRSHSALTKSGVAQFVVETLLDIGSRPIPQVRHAMAHPELHVVMSGWGGSMPEMKAKRKVNQLDRLAEMQWWQQAGQDRGSLDGHSTKERIKGQGKRSSPFPTFINRSISFSFFIEWCISSPNLLPRHMVLVHSGELASVQQLTRHGI